MNGETLDWYPRYFVTRMGRKGDVVVTYCRTSLRYRLGDNATQDKALLVADERRDAAILKCSYMIEFMSAQ